jgi:hypothetical protein
MEWVVLEKPVALRELHGVLGLQYSSELRGVEVRVMVGYSNPTETEWLIGDCSTDEASGSAVGGCGCCSDYIGDTEVLAWRRVVGS